MVLLAFTATVACQPIPAAAARSGNPLLQALPPSELLISIGVSLSCSPKSAKSLVLSVASGSSSTSQQAAIQVSLGGRGRPRRSALAPSLRHRFVVFQDADTLTPSGQIRGAARSPGPRHPPLHQLPDRDEGDAYHVACQRRPQPIGQAVAQAGVCDIGVRDDQAHGMLARREG